MIHKDLREPSKKIVVFPKKIHRFEKPCNLSQFNILRVPRNLIRTSNSNYDVFVMRVDRIVVAVLLVFAFSLVGKPLDDRFEAELGYVGIAAALLATYLLEPGEYKDTLPPLHTVELRCDLPDRKPYEKLKRDLVLEHGGRTITAVNAAVVTGKLQQMAAGFVYDTQNFPDPNVPGKFLTTKHPIWFSEHKFEMLDDLIAENQRANMIIVYNFIEELAELKRRYPHAKTIDDANAIADWNAGKIELLLIHPNSAGHGLNLQHGGCRIAFLSLPWSLE